MHYALSGTCTFGLTGKGGDISFMKGVRSLLLLIGVFPLTSCLLNAGAIAFITYSEVCVSTGCMKRSGLSLFLTNSTCRYTSINRNGWIFGHILSGRMAQMIAYFSPSSSNGEEKKKKKTEWYRFKSKGHIVNCTKNVSKEKFFQEEPYFYFLLKISPL